MTQALVSRARWWLVTAVVVSAGMLASPDRAHEAALEQCPLSHGYWKTHPDAWPVSSLVLGNAANPAHLYAQAQLLQLLALPSKGDASLILAAQLIAAKLNVAAGASPAPVAGELANADALLAPFPGTLPYGVATLSATGAAMTTTAGVLDRYNNGQLPDSCGAINSPPVANAGVDQTVFVGADVRLDGSGSTDANGDPLIFRWTFVTRPDGSAAALSDPAAVRPIFRVDRPGTYTVALVVNDGRSDSVPDTVQVSTENSRPVADAGPDQTVPVGATVVLDGSASHDIDGDALSFVWTLVDRPAGSLAMLSDAGAVQPAFIADVPGRYVVQLVVSDPFVASIPDSVAIDTQNSAPVADAGLDQTVVAGSLVQLDGRGSRDADGDALTFRWSFTARPDGSAAVFDDATSARPTFGADLPGDYVAQLIVNDGTADGAPDTVVVMATLANRPPVVNAGPDLILSLPADTTVLNGTVSDDGLPAGGILSSSWSQASGPGPVSFGNAASPTTTARFPTSGTYVLRLSASDGALIAADDVTVTVNPEPVVNLAPVVDAGPDQSLTLPADTLILNGAVTDDGLPAGGVLTLGWSQVDGPGAVILGAPASAATTARFPGAGRYVLRLTAGDGDLSGSDEVTVTVTAAAVTQPPIITSTPPTSAAVDTLYRYAVGTTQPEPGDTLSFSLPVAPAGMSIDSVTGLVQWTPASAQTGLHQVAVRVQNSGGLFATQGFSIAVATGATNTAPVAQDDAYEARTGESLGVPAPGVLGNDADPDGNPLTARQLTHPRQGTATLDRDGSFSYTPYTFQPGELVRADNVNLGLAVPGTTVRASSSGAVGAGSCTPAGGENPPQCAVDGSVGTSWLSSVNDNARMGANSSSGGGPFLEVLFPQDVTVTELQVAGHRHPFLENSKILAGIFQLFDAAGSEIFNSGVMELPAPDRDARVTVPPLFQRATNIARTTPGVVYRASSVSGDDQPGRAFDGNLLTQWQTNFPAVLPEFLEVEFPADVTVHRVRTLGLRTLLSDRDFTTLVVQAFDATGAVRFDSGSIVVPPANADTTVEVGGLAGIRRVRVTGTAVEIPGASSGLAELEIVGIETVAVPLNDRVRRARFTDTADNGGSVGLAEFKVAGSALVRREALVEPILSQLLPTLARASSAVPGNPPESVIDDSAATNWYAETANAGEFLELEFPLPVVVNQIVTANPSARPDFFATSLTIDCAGTFTLHGADGGVLFDSAVVNEPTGSIFAGDTFTLPIPGVAGVRRVRYTSAGCGPSFPPGFSELKVLGSAPVTMPAFQLARKFQALIGREAHSTPVVANLTDDNGDGVIDARDVPDIVVPVESTDNQLTGEIKVISGDDGRELFTAGGPNLVSPWSEVAVGDLDGDGRPEIVAVHSDGSHLIAFDNTGQVKWISDANPMPAFLLGGATIIGGAVSIANLDGGPRPHIVVGASVFDADGRLLGDGRTLGGTTGGLGLRSAISAVADIDLDGTPELVAGPTAYRLVNGQLTRIWQRADRADGYVAIGNFDDDPFAEIVVVANGFVYMLNHDGTDAEVWNAPTHGPVPIPGGGQGGAPTIADVDGDGIPEIGVAGAAGYTVFNRDGTVRWTSATMDRSSNATGSTVFDFDGDGTVEIVYRDEEYLRIFRGTDGVLLAKIVMQSSTWSELPVVADVDNDGHADIVVTSDRNRDSSLQHTGVYVLQDVANAWVPTRRIWNQHGYHVTNVGEGGAIPTAESPHWLLPGRNNFRLNAAFPTDSADQADSFTYVATDGALESNVATVRIALRAPNSPPRVTSAPVTSAATGVLYTYATRAVDPDPGDVLTFSLPTAPTGMTIDPFAGLVHWTPTPSQLGRHDVVVRVADARGAFALQGYAVEVGSPVLVPDVLGQPQAAAAAAIGAAGLTLGDVGTRPSATTPAGSVLSQNPAGGTPAAPGARVALVVSSGPPPAGIVPDVVGQPQPAAEADIRAATFTVGAITGQNSAQVPLGVVLSQDPAAGTAASSGSAVSLVVSLGRPPGDLDLDGDGFTGNQGDCDDANPNIHPGAADTAGDGIDQNCNGRDSIAGDDTPPSAVIESPADLAIVMMPTDIVGTASDASFLRYRLELSPVDDSATTLIGSGTSPVVGGVLGRLDPTLLENGLYRVRLLAEDVNGQVSVDERVYRVSGEAKIGVVALSFMDLQVSIAGIPITVLRSYDSRVKTRRDFGVGWTLAVRRGSYRHNRTPGDGWIIQDRPFLGEFLPCIGGTAETRSHVTEVRLSDRESYTFALRITNGNLGITGACEGVASYELVQGTTPGATLDILDGTGVIYLRGGPDQVLDMNAFLEGTERVYSPQRVVLTTIDGRKIELTLADGITRIEDLAGNALTIAAGGIVHSRGASVTFTRDAQERITAVTDPTGGVRRYEYDGRDDLVRVTGLDGRPSTFAYDDRHNLVRMDTDANRPVQMVYDAEGRLVEVIDADGNRRRLDHDLANRVEVTTDALGHQTIHEYSERGDIVRTTDALGNVTRSTFDADGNELSTTDALGRTTTRTFNASGHKLTETAPDGGARTWTYNARNQLTSAQDALGNLRTYSYDTRGNLVSETDPLGGRTTHTYDAAGTRLSTTDCRANATRYTYDAAGRRLSRTDALGNVTTYTYDGNGNRLTETRTRTVAGQTVLLTTIRAYDSAGRVIRETDPAGNTTFTEYHFSGLPARLVQPLGTAETREYGSTVSALTRRVHADGSTQVNTYDAQGNLVTTTDESGNVVRREYDVLNRIVRTVAADGAVTRREYDAVGNLVAVVDPAGNRVEMEYDAFSRTTLVRDALGNQTRSQYDLVGNLVAIIDPRGHTTRHEYDALQRRVRTVFPDGTSRTLTYLACTGLKETETDQAGLSTGFEYDSLDRLVRVRDSAGGITVHAYDQVGNRISQTDANGRVTRLEYDNAGRLVRRQLPLGQTERFAHDGNGNVVTHTDFNGRTTTFTYDSRNRLLAKAFPDGTRHSYAFAPTGLRTLAGDDRLEYDARGRLVRDAGPIGALTYAYDAAGNRVAVTTPFGTTRYGYDAQNRLTTTTAPDGGVSTYTYDANGNRSRLVRPNGVTTEYVYDSLNRLVQLRNLDPSGQPLAVYDYQLSPSGHRTRVQESGPATTGRTVDYTYDAAYRLVEERIDEPGTDRDRIIAYEYDLVGNRTRRTVTTGSRLATTVFSYDANDRLVQETTTVTNGSLVSLAAPSTAPADPAALGSAAMVHERAAVAHLATSTGILLLGFVVTLQATTRSRRYGRRRALLASGLPLALLALLGVLVAPAPASGLGVGEFPGEAPIVATPAQPLVGETIAYAYDANGNMVTRSSGTGRDTYEYDDDNRLRRAVLELGPAPGVYSYEYDADGIRRSVTANGRRTEYLVDRQPGLQRVLAEQTDGEVVTYVYGHELLSQARPTAGTSHYLRDGHMSVRQLTDGAGAVTDTYTYDAFGTLLSAAGTTTNVYLYAGEQYDPNVGFYYLRARYYHASTGRFLSQDPFAGSVLEPVTLHRYLYANANPVMFRDPTGRWSMAEIAVVMGMYLVVMTAADLFVHGVMLGTLQFFSDAKREVTWNGTAVQVGAGRVPVGGSGVYFHGESDCRFDRHGKFVKQFVVALGAIAGFDVSVPIPGVPFSVQVGGFLPDQPATFVSPGVIGPSTVAFFGVASAISVGLTAGPTFFNLGVQQMGSAVSLSSEALSTSTVGFTSLGAGWQMGISTPVYAPDATPCPPRF